MLVGKTKTGFEYQISEAVFDNMELIDLLAVMEDDETKSAYCASKVVGIVLGKDGKKALYEHLRKDGIVSASEVMSTIEEIFNAAGDKAKKL